MLDSATKTGCPDADVLHRFVADQLSESEAVAIEEHLERCDVCEKTVERLERNNTEQQNKSKQSSQDSITPSQESLLHRLADPERIEKVPLPEFSIPKQIDKYEILEVLGSGGMGTVLRAKHVHLKREVAIKLVKGVRRFDPRAVSRFMQEIEAIGKLDHANIVRAYDAGCVPHGRSELPLDGNNPLPLVANPLEHNNVQGMPYLVMELLQGRDVETLIKRRGPLSQDDACKLIRQAATGLDQIHRAGLVHRDVKPSNLFVTKTGVVKLLDLGLARLYENDEPEVFNDMPTGDGSEVETRDGLTAGPLTSKMTVLGSPLFMAPEQIEQSHRVDHRADIYSLGCTLYFLLTGKPPYAGTQVEVLAAHLEGKIPSVNDCRSDVQPTLEKLVRWMMARTPRDRIGSAKEIIGVLDKLKESAKPQQNVIVTPPPLPPPRRIDTEKKSTRIGIFVLAALVIVAGITSLLIFSSRPPQAVGELASDNQSNAASVETMEPQPIEEQIATVKPVAVAEVTTDEVTKQEIPLLTNVPTVPVDSVTPVSATKSSSLNAEPPKQKPLPEPPRPTQIPAPTPNPPIEVKPVKVEPIVPPPLDPKDDPKNIPQNKLFWNKAMSGRVSFDYESNSGCSAIGEGIYMFEISWSPRGADDIYITSNGQSVAAVALVPGRGSPKRITQGSRLDYSSYYRAVKVGEQAVLRNRHGKYAVVQVNRVVNRDRVPAPRSLLDFSYCILKDGDDFSKAK